MTAAATELPKISLRVIYPNDSLVTLDQNIAETREECTGYESRFAHSYIITGSEYSLPSTRPIIKDENLNSNQRMELINVAQVTLKTVEYFLLDHPVPQEAPADKMAEITRYLDAGMSLPYAARVDTVGENRLVPQPDVIFPPAKPGSYCFHGTTLMIRNTMGGHVPVTLLIECMKERA